MVPSGIINNKKDRPTEENKKRKGKIWPNTRKRMTDGASECFKNGSGWSKEWEVSKSTFDFM